MSTKRTQSAYVCLRCANRLAAQNRRLLSTTSRRLEDRNNTQKPVAVKGWTSFIKNKYLGKSASVLVLRDFESNRRAPFVARDDTPNLQLKDIQDVNLQDLRASISAQKKAPGQEDVNTSINHMRDKLRSTSPFSGIRAITKAAYDQIAHDLGEAFNQAQISRYISIQEGDRFLKEQKHARKQQKQNKSANGKLRLSEWKPVQGTAKSAKTKDLRKKKTLIDALIRSAWGFEVVEEIEAAGVVAISLTHPQHLTWLLHGEADSHLSKIGRITNVEIQVHPSENKLEITGTKYQCLKAATEIDRLLHEVVELSINLKPLPRDEQSLAKIRDIFQRSRCLIEWDETKRKASVLAGSQAEAEQLQRSLVNATNTSGAPEQLLLDGSRSDGGYLWPSTPFTRSRVLVFSPPDKGRFVDSIDFNRGSAKQPPPVSDEMSQSIWSHLNSSSTIERSPDVTSILRAEPGVLLHRTNGDGLQYLSPSELLSSNSYNFRPLSIGLPQLLALGGRTATSTLTNKIRIRLVPSPWAPKPSTSKSPAKKQLPALELDLTLDETTRRVQIDQLNALITHRTAALQLPAHATDARFTRRDLLRLPATDPHAAPSIAAFVAHVAASAAGFGRVAPPTTLAVPLPSHFLPDGQVLAEYFTVNLEFVQELVFPVSAPSTDSGLSLVVTSRSTAAAPGTGMVGGNAQGRESVALVSQRRHSTSSPDDDGLDGGDGLVDLEGESRREEERDFMQAVNDMLVTVNRVAGDQRVLERESHRSFEEGGEGGGLFKLPVKGH